MSALLRLEPRREAPGRPGIGPTWMSSAKDMVGCALAPSRVWFTVGYGILNEIYYPHVDIPQVRDLGFIIADAGMTAVIPSKRDRKTPIAHDAALYKTRNRIERCFDKLKHFRRIATRYDRRAIHFLAFIHIASAALTDALNVDSA